MAFAANLSITTKGKEAITQRLLSNSQPVFKHVAMGTGATGAARTAGPADTALSTEVETRTSGTATLETGTSNNDTYTVTGTITATAGRAIDEVGLFDAASSGNLIVSATVAVINLSSGDSLNTTFKTKFQ